MTSVAQRPFSEIFGGMPGDAEIAQLAAAAARAGYAVLPIAPGEKTPLCPLTQRQRDQADRMAAEAARDAGRGSDGAWRKVRHPCGIEHATTDPKLARRWFRRLDEQHPDVNMAIAMAPSRVLVADCDTAAELASFTTLWARAEGRPELIQAAPTVRSPGKQDEDGHWSHCEGGHFYFLLPEDVDLGDLADVTTILVGTDPEHQAQLKVGGYALVPPSVRAEGPYVMESDAHIAPDWLVDLVLDYIQHRRAVRIERRDAALDADDMIRVVQSGIPWSAILDPRGWVDSGKASRCGCPEWTAPGDHGSPKSATAHDPGCGDFDTPDGFIHIWTDNPPDGISAAGTKTFSKIQFVAWHDHEGDMSAAMVELDINRIGGGGGTVLDDEEVERLLAQTTPPPAERVLPVSQIEDDDEDGDEDTEDDDADVEEDVDPVQALLAELIPASGLDGIPPPTPLVPGLLDRDSLARVIGKSGHGKSFFMIDIAGHVALGMDWHGRPCTQGDVVYMVAEGAAGIRKRVRAWERYHEVELGERVRFLPRPVQVKSDEWNVWIAAMATLKPALIVVDTQARVTAGANENGPEDMGLLVQRLERLRRYTGACIVLVHHKGHSGEHGRGHSSVIAAMDAEIEVTKEDKAKIAILSTKQKDEEDFDPIRLQGIKVEVEIDGQTKTSLVLVEPGADGQEPDGHPFDEIKTVSEMSSARDRVAAALYRTFVQGSSGATKGEIKTVVLKTDRGPNGRPMSGRTFLRSWSELESDNVLVRNGAHFELDPAEAVRLGLRDED
jgi:hypothetical protein